MKQKLILITLIFISFTIFSCGSDQTAKQNDKTTQIDTKAIFSDGSRQYMFPQEPKKNESILVKLRVGANNISKAILHVNDAAIEMQKSSTVGKFDYYVAEIKGSTENTSYYFEVQKGTKNVYYSRRGVEQKPPSSSFRFKYLVDFSVPEWMKGAVLYQIYVDRFANGDTTNDVLTNEYMYDNWPVKKIDDWYALPDGSTKYTDGSNRTREFFGGDLQGVIDKLDYLKDLGIEGIYFNPIFVSPSNHKYDTQDYENIDPHVGVIVKDGGNLIDPEKDLYYKKANSGGLSTENKNASKYIMRTTSKENLDASNAKLAELIEKAHAKGIKVILDGVYNHSGSFNKWLDREHLYPDSVEKGAYEAKTSPYASYYKFTKDAWPNNESYEAWYGFKTLPKLNFEGSKELEGKILASAEKWVGNDYKVDGFRLDVAADLGYSPQYNHAFWQKFRTSVKETNKDAVILAEVYGDSSAWLQGNEWDSVMNYDAFFEPLGYFFTGLEKHSYQYYPKLHNDAKTFEKDLREKMAKLPYNSLEIAMNQLSNHDHSRFLTRTSGFVDSDRPNTDSSPQVKALDGVNKGILKEATVLQMTLPGAPTLYYGDEAGLAGFTDPDSRRTYPWGKEDKELLAFYKELISLHKTYSSIKTGSYLPLWYLDSGFFAFARFDSESVVLVAVNNTDKEKTVNIPLNAINIKDGSVFTGIFESTKDEHGKNEKKLSVNQGKIEVKLKPFASLILKGDGIKEETVLTQAERPKAEKPIIKDDGSFSIAFNKEMNVLSLSELVTFTPELEGSFVMNGKVLYFTPDSKKKKGDYKVEIKKELCSELGGFSMQNDILFTMSIK